MTIKNLKTLLKDYCIIDTHLHIGPLYNLFIPSNTIEETIRLIKEFGVKKAICSTHSSLSTVWYGIDELFTILQKYEGFLYGYFVFNPNFEDFSLKKVEEYIDNKFIMGIKIHPSWHKCYPYDKKYERFWGLANERKIPVLTHSWNPNVPNKEQKYSSPFFFEDIVKRYPGIQLILAHAGGRGKMLYDVISLLEKNRNVYVDFSGDIFVPGLIEEYVKRVGSERLLFGTDMPWVDIRFQLSNIINLDISENDKRNILGLNALKLFGFDN